MIICSMYVFMSAINLYGPEIFVLSVAVLPRLGSTYNVSEGRLQQCQGRSLKHESSV